MKRHTTIICAVLLLAGLLAGCGGKKQEETPVDLNAFFDQLKTEYQWDDRYMVDLTDDLLDSYYPGLRELSTKQMVAKMPMMSAVVSELVLVECENAEDATTAAGILQDRADAQAEGGAWYPESMEAWGSAEVITQGNYVALIASAEHQSEISGAFNKLFA